MGGGWGGGGAVGGGMRKGSWNFLGERVGIASEQRGGMRGGSGWWLGGGAVRGGMRGGGGTL